MHTELLQRIGLGDEPPWDAPSGLYAVAYRSVFENAHTRVDWWPEALVLRATMPTLPLWIASDKSIPLDLESSYMSACEGLKVPFSSAERNGA